MITKKVVALCCILILFVAQVPSLLFTVRFYRRLRTKHMQVWRQLGSPRMLSVFMRWRDRVALRSWWSRHGYEELDDAELDRLARFRRLTYWSVMPLLLVALIILFTMRPV